MVRRHLHLFSHCYLTFKVLFAYICSVHCTSLDMGNDCVTKLSAFRSPGPKYVVQMNDIPSGKLTFKYAKSAIFWEAVFTFLFVEMLDSYGTLSGLFQRCGFFENVELGMSRLNKAMCVDGMSLIFGGIIGANSCTVYVESTTGVAAGARTGLASIVTGSAFFLSLLFVAPFVALIPDAATTCALVMVGVHTISALKDVDFDDFAELMTAFLTIATMGFTYSVSLLYHIFLIFK
jgi:xanthine/uracil/vitamin C permease (AzgA family)